jgi:NTP pyrophosphatase (non-canonical NTP hydrolase)
MTKTKNDSPNINLEELTFLTTFDQYDDFIKEISKEYTIKDPAHTLELVAFGLLEEAGEVAGKLKRKYREGEFDITEIAKELGDVLGYLTCICNELNISLVDVANMNYKKLMKRKEAKTLVGSGDNR